MGVHPKEEGAGRATSGLPTWGPTRAGGCPPWPANHVGFSPTWLSQGGWPPPLAYIRRGTPLLLGIQLSPNSLSLSLTCGSGILELHMGLGVSAPSARRRAAGASVRAVHLPLLPLDRSRGIVATPYVCRTMEVLHLRHSDTSQTYL